MDVLSKLQESNARANRAIAKAITSCGCISVEASRQPISSDTSLEEFRQQVASHLNGELCEHCRDIVERELGANMFYLTALCNILGLKLHDVLSKEMKQLKTLGIFNLS
jgi:hypothetical protein